MANYFAPFRAVGRWAKGLFQKSYGRVSRTSQLRRYLDGSAYGSMFNWNHFRETTHVAEGQGTPWTYIASHALAVKAAESTVTVYRDEDPRLPRNRRQMRKSVAHIPDETENRLIDAAEQLDQRYCFDGRGQLFWHPGTQEAWFVTCNSNSPEEAHACAQALDDAGAPEVRIESEVTPSQDRGWVQLYPRQQKHLSGRGRQRYWQKACQSYVRRLKLTKKANEHPHDLDKPHRQPVHDRDGFAALMRRPNPGQSGPEFFYALVQQIPITGGAIVWKVKDKKYDRIRELYIIPTGLVQPFPPSGEYPFGCIRVTPLPVYQTPMNNEGYVAPGALGELLTTGAIIDCRDIFKVGWPHPLYPADFLSPLKAGSMTVDCAGQIDRARFASLLNVLRPGFIFEADKEIWKDVSQDEKDAWIETLNAVYGGAMNFDKSFMLPPGVEAKQTQRTPVEMDFVQSYTQMRDAELGLHQTPPVAVGMSQASAYAAYYAALQQYQDIAQPLFSLVARAFERNLGPIFAAYERGLVRDEQVVELARELELNHGYEVEIKLPNINDPDIKDRMVRNLTQGKAITKNELRQIYKLPLSKERWGDEVVGEAPQPGTDPLQAIQGLIPGQPGAAIPAAGQVPGQQPGQPGAQPSANGKANPQQPPGKNGPNVREPARDAVPGRPSVGPQQNTRAKSWQPKANWKGSVFTKAAHSYSCVYADLEHASPILADLIRAYRAAIDKADLAEKVPDPEIHTTVLYGLHTDDSQKVADILTDVQPFGIRLHRTNVFAHEDKDVLYIDLDRLECRALVGLNALLKEQLAYTDKWPEYRPHICIAYLKPGRGAKYQGDPFVDGLEVAFSQLVFVTAAGKKTILPLGVTGTQARLNRDARLIDGAQGDPYELNIGGGEQSRLHNLLFSSEAQRRGMAEQHGIATKAVKGPTGKEENGTTAKQPPTKAPPKPPEGPQRRTTLVNGTARNLPQSENDHAEDVEARRKDRAPAQSFDPNGAQVPLTIAAAEEYQRVLDQRHLLPHVREGMYVCPVCEQRYHTFDAGQQCCDAEPLVMRSFQPREENGAPKKVSSGAVHQQVVQIVEPTEELRQEAPADAFRERNPQFSEHY